LTGGRKDNRVAAIPGLDDAPSATRPNVRDNTSPDHCPGRPRSRFPDASCGSSRTPPDNDHDPGNESHQTCAVSGIIAAPCLPLALASSRFRPEPTQLSCGLEMGRGALPYGTFHCSRGPATAASNSPDTCKFRRVTSIALVPFRCPLNAPLTSRALLRTLGADEHPNPPPSRLC